MVEYTVGSGLPSEARLAEEDYWFTGLGYGRHWKSGPDMDLFNYDIANSNGDRIEYDETSRKLVAYYRTYTAARPLPRGAYEFYTHSQSVFGTPCDYRGEGDNEGQKRIVTVESSVGALHEAFFDPVDLGGSTVEIRCRFSSIADVMGQESPHRN